MVLWRGWGCLIILLINYTKFVCMYLQFHVITFDYIVWLSLISDTDWPKHSHVIDKHFSMLPSPELRRRNIDRYHTFFHANKWQTELAILSLQTCMLTVLAAHWLFYCAHSTMDTRCTAAHSTMDTHCTAHNLKGNPRWKKYWGL